MITLTITDAEDSATFATFSVPVVSQPVIAETDVQTIDVNISTYFTGSKRSFEFNLGFQSKESYAILEGFRDRQYSLMKYPQITITGDENINVTNMTAKMTLSPQNIIDNCGNVEDCVVTFRESRQML